MPEVAVDENGDSGLDEYHVWSARQSLHVLSVAQSPPIEGGSQNNLNIRVSILDTRHAIPALFNR